MRILVCVKQLPDHQGVRKFTGENLVDRDAATGILGELDEYAIEQAMQLVEKHGGTTVALCMGPDEAEKSVRRALQMGIDEGFLISDEALRGSDALGTSLTLASAIDALAEDGGAFDLILAGMSSTDSYMGVMPAMLAERLGLPQLTFATTLDVSFPGSRPGLATITRVMDGRQDVLEAELPALVSITDQMPAARRPTTRDLIAGKRKPIRRWSLSDVSVDPVRVGRAAAAAVISKAEEQPPRAQGRIIVEDGTGSAAIELAAFLSTYIPTSHKSAQRSST